MLLIKSADEAAAYNPVAVPEEEAPRAKGRHDFDVGRRFADKIGVIVFKILARSNPFRQTGRIGAERESGDEISSRAQAFHSVLHELIEALNDRRHGYHR